MPLKNNNLKPNPVREKEIYTFLNQFLNSKYTDIYMRTIPKRIFKTLSFNGFSIYNPMFKEYYIFYYESTNLNHQKRHIYKKLLQFIIDETPFFKEIIPLSSDLENYTTNYFTSNVSFNAYKSIPMTYTLINQNFDENNILAINIILDNLYMLSQYMLGSDIITMSHTHQNKETQNANNNKQTNI